MTAPHLADLFAGLADAAVKGTLILLAALAATRLMRRRSAAARHLVWMVALASMLALPLATRLLPAWRVVPVPAPLRPAARFVAAPAASSAGVLRSDAHPSAALPDADAASLSSHNTASPNSTAAYGSTSSPSRPSISSTVQDETAFDWKTAMLVLWAAGGAVLALRLGYGLARVWWMQRRATEIDDEEWVRITDRLARRLRVGRLVTLLREQHAVVPMTWGIVRPVVLLPSDAEKWDTERRTVVLAHELAHVRRWDTLTQWIAHLALAAFWFHPLVWMAARRMREEREHACDDAVLSIGTRPVEYADHLLNIVRSLGQSEGPAAALAMARRSQFEGRLLAILDGATQRGGVTRGLGLAALAVAAAAVLPLAALRPALARPAQTAPIAQAKQSAPTEQTLSLAIQPHALDVGSVARALVDAPRQAPPPSASGKSPAALSKLEGEKTPAGRTVVASPPSAPLLAVTTAPPATTATLLSRLETSADPGLYGAIIRAANEIQSSTDRRLVLTALLGKDDLSAENVTAIIRSTLSIHSDTDRRLVLSAAQGHRAFPTNPVPHVYFEALAAFGSSTEERLVMEGLLARHRLSADGLAPLFDELRRMGSNTDRRLVLSTAAATQTMSGASREAYVAATRAITSDSDRRLALDALMSAGPREAKPGSSASTSTPAAGETAAGSTAGGREQEWNGDVVLELDGGRDVAIHTRGVMFGRARWDVLRIGRGGSLVVREDRGGTVRRLSAVPGADGRPVFTYTVDGHTRDFDDAGRGWFQAMVREFTGS